MLYRCIWAGCDKIWDNLEEGVKGYSHGLCSVHTRFAFENTFRRLQIKEGNPDCYLRCFGNCQRHWCTFHPICTVEDPGTEEMAELQIRLNTRRQSIHLTD
jgi:hypothetical protein